MSASYTTLAERSRANAANLRRVSDDARERKKEVQASVNEIVHAMADFYASGASREYIDDCLTGLLDQASNIIAGLERKLDEAGGYYPLVLDLSEVEALLGKIRGK